MKLLERDSFPISYRVGWEVGGNPQPKGGRAVQFPLSGQEQTEHFSKFNYHL